TATWSSSDAPTTKSRSTVSGSNPPRSRPCWPRCPASNRPWSSSTTRRRAPGSSSAM
ncbi:AMP-binding enzyme, partial [Streptomyces ipomoeae 91-03]